MPGQDTFLGAINEAAEQAVVAGLQMYPVTNLATDFLWMGYNGGSVRNVAQIVVRGNRVIGTTGESWRYDPLQNTSDVFSQPSPGQYELKIKPGGLTTADWDGRYETGGCAGRLTNGDYIAAEERTALRERMMVNDIKWLVGKSPRRPLTDDIGVFTGYEVIDVPCSEGFVDGYLKVLDPRGINWGQAWKGVVQSLIYGAMDELVYGPLVEEPIKWIRAYGKEIGNKDLESMPIDGFYRAELRTVSEWVNRLYGLPERDELGI